MGACYVQSVPGPIVGAGLPGLVAACLTMLGIRRYWNKRQFGTAYLAGPTTTVVALIHGHPFGACP